MVPAELKVANTLKHFIFLSLFFLIFYKTGEAQKVINEYARIIHVFNADSTDIDSVRVDNSVFKDGDTVLFIVMKGVEVYTPYNDSGYPGFWGLVSDPNNVGIYNVLLIHKVLGDTVIFKTGLRKYVPDKPGEIAQLVKIRGGRDVYRVDEPLTCAPWDPVKGTGGVFALIAGRKIILNNTIDVTGKGFCGGDPNYTLQKIPSIDYFNGNCSEAVDSFYTEVADDSSGRKGESNVYEGFPYTRGRLFVAHGGGGGNGKYSGGGGGGNYSAGGQGGMESESCTPGTNNLGGMSNYLLSWYSNEGYFPNRIFLGGGGGTGTQNPDQARYATKGGNGGGIIILITDTIEAIGSQIVRSGGGSVTDMASAGAGGGGGGGVIVLDATKYLGTLTFDVSGGNGGWTNHTDPTGPGGFGGAGVIWHSGDLKLITVPRISLNLINGDPGEHTVEGLRGAAKKSSLKGTIINNLKIPLSGFLFNIMPEDQSICEGDIPPIFIASWPKGGDGPGTYTYKWIWSLDKINWTDAPVPNTDKDYSSGALTDTTYFRRIVSSGTTVDTSEILTINVLPYPLMNLTFTSFNTSSIGGTDGSAVLQIGGGLPPYTFLWSDGQTSDIVYGLSEGIYSVIVTDRRDTTLIDSIRIYDTFIDERDGKRYRAVTIGDRIWMADNLNVGQQIVNTQDQTDNQIIEKFCLNNDEAQCDTVGGLYQWDEMMQYSQTGGTQGICPTGWYLPGDEEWKWLEMTLGMTQMEADDWAVWRGADAGMKLKPGGSSGFDALFAGYRSWEVPNDFTDPGISGYYWSSDYGIENSPVTAIYRTITQTQPGIYRYESDRANGYSVRCVTSICDLKAMSVSDSIINVNCYGQSNGEIQLTVTGGNPPYSFLWSNGATTSSVFNVKSGLHSVVISDLMKCQQNKSYVVSEPNPLVLSFNTTDLLCNGDSDGVTTAIVTGGTSPYLFQWNTGETAQSISNLTANIYSVIVTDSHDCMVIGSESVTEPSPVTTSPISGPLQVIVDENATYSVINVSGSVFDWSVTGGNIISGQGTNSVDISWGTAGTAEISVTETNLNGCNGSPVNLQVEINTVGVGQLHSHALKIYPNPASDRIFIRFPNLNEDNYRLILMDLTGKIIKETDDIRSGNFSIEITGLPSGVYFIELMGPVMYKGSIILE